MEKDTSPTSAAHNDPTSNDERPAPRTDSIACPAARTCPVPTRRRDGFYRRIPLLRGLPPMCLVATLGTLAVCACLLVGTDLLTRRVFPNLGTAWRHGLLTAVAVMSTGIIYFVIHRQQVRLTATATQLSDLIRSSYANPSSPGRFVNPHLVHCRQVMNCNQANCPMHHAANAGKRCWEVMAARRAAQDDVPPWVEMERCLQCPVYRQSCPNSITELGESFNSLAFLLETESQRASGMLALMAEKEKMVAIGQLAAGVAHEVCNPLSSISAVVQMLKRKPGAAGTAEQLDIIEAHIRRITGIVRKLTSLAHPGADRWENVDVCTAVDEVVRLVTFDRRARRILIGWTRPEKALMTYAVRNQLQQVFINLALNALDAMPEGGKLTFATGRQDGKIVVRIEDTGCGIPDDVGRRVFEPFFTTKPEGRGTGLGLAVSYGIVQKHGGAIDFNSVPGTGTAFTVELPILSAPRGT
jgi:signal transduction histidine kinase